jgi:multiple antibiotic resistance protein
VFVALTRAMSPRQRRLAVVRAMLGAAALIVGFALFGGVLLDCLGVSLGSLSVAGGLLLLLVALEMLRGMDMPPEEDGDIALVPLATPLVAGPGAIATVIVLARQRPESAVIGGALAAVVAMGFTAAPGRRHRPSGFARAAAFLHPASSGCCSPRSR